MHKTDKKPTPCMFLSIFDQSRMLGIFKRDRMREPGSDGNLNVMFFKNYFQKIFH